MKSSTNTLDERRKIRKGIEGYHLKDKAVMIDALKEKYGSSVVDVIETARGKMMREIWQNIAQKVGDDSIDSLIANLWSDVFFDYTYTTNDKDETTMNVTWCLFAEVARELKLQNLAFHLYCVDDPHIVEGFNPKMGFKRTKTLMEGHDCCNHCYWMKKE